MKLNKMIVIGIINYEGKIDSVPIHYKDAIGHLKIWGESGKRWRWYPKIGIRESVYGDSITTEDEERIIKHLQEEYNIETKEE